MQKLVEDGKLGAKSGGEGFYKDGEPQIEGDADPDPEELADLFVLKSLVEACRCSRRASPRSARSTSG